VARLSQNFEVKSDILQSQITTEKLASETGLRELEIRLQGFHTENKSFQKKVRV